METNTSSSVKKLTELQNQDGTCGKVAANVDNTVLSGRRSLSYVGTLVESVDWVEERGCKIVLGQFR